ncbi:MAG: protein-arginine deiminase domain-containing protein [Sandaracinaceae bacterium]|nr:protein-arginine deiminase domain-containing protein [Sandaracinaceae bacterium]
MTTTGPNGSRSSLEPRDLRRQCRPGKYEPFVADPRTPTAILCCEIDIDDLLHTPVARLPERGLAREDSGSAAPTITVREYNDRLQRAKLTPIAQRLRAGLGLDESDALPIPTYFRVPDAYESDHIVRPDRRHKTRALTMGCVNLQVVGSHVLVPRPVGPRLPAAEARQVLGDVLRTLGLGHLSVRLGSESVRHWSSPRERNGTIHHYYAQLSQADRRLLVDALQANRSSVTLSEAGRQAVDAVRQRVAPAFRDPSGSVPRWRLTVIDGCGVDLIESFLLTILAPLGLTVHFIEAWYYRINDGGVHCATNVRRTPPAERWWEHGYDPVGPRWRYSPRRPSAR